MTMPLFGFIFGGIPETFFGMVLYILCCVLATRRVIDNLDGVAVPAWLAFIWLVPCLGGILALVAVRKKPTEPSRIDPSKSD
ncbi:MAG: hypothetical protein DVB23_002788 [Verrucomicrobia bacterium]|jgi:hypothetical protein|nr:MAG: hypothetical protein DVB23_002788 [Verrucomicrobiota bacterium]